MLLDSKRMDDVAGGTGGAVSGSDTIGTTSQRVDAGGVDDAAVATATNASTTPTTANAVSQGPTDLHDAGVGAGTMTPEPSSSQALAPSPTFLQRISKLALRGLRSVTLWTIFGIITTFFFTVPSGLSAWQTLVVGSGEDADPEPLKLGHLDPAIAMVCLEFAEHPIVHQSGQCADISLSDLQALSLKQDKPSPTRGTFEDFAIVREIPRTSVAYSEARKWPPRSVGPWVQWPVLATDIPGNPGSAWLADASEHHYKEWATRIQELYIPITHHLLVHQDGEWQFQSAASFFSTRNLFSTLWPGYIFSLASLSSPSDPDCLDCLHAPVPLVSLKHPYNITLQRKEEDNPLLRMDALDCEELYRWATNQQWRRECVWPEVYQNLERLRERGWMDQEPGLSMEELGRVVREEGWGWRVRPYV